MTRRILLPAAVAAAAAALSTSLLSHAGGAVAASPAGPRTGVVVVNTDTDLGTFHSAAAGTGIVLSSSGVVLTNNHVIRGATTIHVKDPSDGLTFSAKALGYSELKDVALIQLQHPRGLHPASIGNSSTARIGQAVTAVGNAGGTGSLTVVTGLVTGLGQAITVSDDQGSTNRLVGLIETNAPLQPGDSGGPLLASGHVIGVDSAASSRNFDSASDGYAIPINAALSIARQIESGRRSSTVHVGPTAFLGVLLDAGASGATVQTILPGSAADRAGIQPGDVIVRAGGRTITSASQLHTVVVKATPGKPLRLTWVSSLGRRTTATIRPTAGPPQ